MNDETKKLFDASWYVFSSPDDEITVIENESGRVLAELDDVKTANRLARLPELYEALMEAKNEMFIILNEWALGKHEVDYLASYKEREGKNNYEFFNEIQELLRKVGDGE